MSLTLVIVGGAYAGQQIQVSDGQIFRIGRTEKSDFAIPSDTYLSGAHFEVACDQNEGRIRDLGSANGTFVNGLRIEQASLREGDHIAAGETLFVVQGASVAAAPEARLVPPSAQVPSNRTERMKAPDFQPAPRQAGARLSAEHKRVFDILTSQTSPLFGLLDLARDGGVTRSLQSMKLRWQPVFEHGQSIQPFSHAPCLIEFGQVNDASRQAEIQSFLEEILHLGWGKRWGVFFTSHSSLDDVTTHFYNFLLVRGKDPQTFHLRFYDPRILRAFLPACEPQEVEVVFGPIVSYLLESERPDLMLVFSRGGEGLSATSVSLAGQPLHKPAGA